MSKVVLGFGLLAATVSAVPQTQTVSKRAQFEVVSIKQNVSGEPRGLLRVSPDGDRVTVSNAPLFRIVAFAFDSLRNDLVIGAPEWARTERWDIDAKVDPADLAAFHAMSFKEQKAMLQPVLKERCKMQARIEKRVVPVYALKVAKGGLKMHELLPGEEPPAVRDKDGQVVQEWDLKVKRGEVHGRAVPMEALMYVLAGASLDRPLVDQTGLKARYDFDLVWTPQEELEALLGTGAADAGIPDAAHVSIFTALREQLGLRFEATKASLDALVIEHLERPTAN